MYKHWHQRQQYKGRFLFEFQLQKPHPHPTRASTVLPLDVLGPVSACSSAAVLPAPAHRRSSGAHRAVLGFSRPLKKFCRTLCCVGLGAFLSIGDFGAPAPSRPPSVAPELALSISASIHLIVSSENDDEPKRPTSQAAGGADPSVRVRKILRGSRSASRAFMS